MSKAGMIGMELAARQILAVGDTLTDEQWQLPSAASGWSVQDVVTHAGCLLGFLMEQVGGAAMPDIGIEKLNEIQVAEKRGWNSRQTLEFLRTQLEKGLAAFAPLQDEPLASTEAQLVDLGTYPLHAIADMFTFDLTTHLRYDILAPRGPVKADVPPLGEAQLGPAVSWLLGGIPKMQPGLPRDIPAPLALNLTGPAATRAMISVEGGAIAVVPLAESSHQPSATVTSSTPDFLAWSTKRLPWGPLVLVDGDRSAAQRFLDALNLV